MKWEARRTLNRLHSLCRHERKKRKGKSLYEAEAFFLLFDLEKKKKCDSRLSLSARGCGLSDRRRRRRNSVRELVHWSSQGSICQ